MSLFSSHRKYEAHVISLQYVRGHTLLQNCVAVCRGIELHATWFLYQPLLSLAAGLQPLPTDRWRYASRFPHWWHKLLLVIQLVPRLACLPFDHQEPYEVGLVDRAAKKLSPLLDPGDTAPCFEEYSCSIYLCSWSSLLDTQRIPHRLCDSWLLRVGCESELSLHIILRECLVIALHLLNQKAQCSLLLVTPASAWPEQLCSSFSMSSLHWRAPKGMTRLCGKWHRSSGDGGFLPPGPCGQIYSCQPVEGRCFSRLQKSSCNMDVIYPQ